MTDEPIGKTDDRLRNLSAWMIKHDYDMSCGPNTIDPAEAADILIAYGEHIAELETENERLREALEEIYNRNEDDGLIDMICEEALKAEKI